MWYLIIIAIAIVAILLIKNKTPGSASKGGEDLGTAKNPAQGKTIPATVVRKDICTPSQKDSQPTFYYTSTQNKPQTAKVYGILHFELDNKKRKSFYVSKKDFRAVSEGFHGNLTFLGNHFIKFDPDTEILMESE
ncbi:MAG: DUF2500 family protein [Eubacterium sp.]|nr:DUF2500 family protein [Eubacterium sp.]